MNNRDVSHEWARDPFATLDGSNLFSRNGSIYSYGSHFTIAKYSEGAILFTERGYSSTTAKHKSYVLQAISHKKIIYVPNLDKDYDYNLKLWEEDIQDRLKRLSSARLIQSHIEKINEELDNIEAYHNLYKLKVPKFVGKTRTFIESDDLNGALIKQKETYAKAKKKERQAALKQFEIDLKNWSNQTENKTPRDPDGYSYLRYHRANQYVETTKGIVVSKTDAINLYRALKAGKIEQGQLILDRYRVKEVNDKILSANCHSFKMSHLLSFGEQLLTIID